MARQWSRSAPVSAVAGAPARQAAPALADSQWPLQSASARWPPKAQVAPEAPRRRSAEQRALQEPHAARGPAPHFLPAASVMEPEWRQAGPARARGLVSAAQRVGLAVSAPTLAGAPVLALTVVLHRLVGRPADRVATQPASVAQAREGAQQGLVGTLVGASPASATDQARPLALRLTAAPLGPAGFLVPAYGLLAPRRPRGQRRRHPTAVWSEDRSWPGTM